MVFNFYKVFVLLIVPFLAYSQSLRINEFMPVNSATVMDEDSEFSDWIEIYNSDTLAIQLAGWALTDDSTEVNKWVFAEGSIPAGEYLVVFASDKNRINGPEFHTNFKITSAGEYLALVRPDSSKASEFLTFPVISADMSYAFFPEGFEVTVNPTPGAINIYNEYIFVNQPVFSHTHGFYDQLFYLQISADNLNQQIYYTTDGSEPSPNNGMLYSDSLAIDNTTVLRAIAVIGDSLSRITTATYLFINDIVNQSNDPPGYPQMWGPYHAEITGDAIADYEMDPDVTSLYPDDIYDALLALPTLSIVTKIGNLFAHSLDPDTGGIYIYTGDADDNPNGAPGSGWERPASVEYFNAEGSAGFQIDAGLKLHGGHSRRPEKTPKHSFTISFKSEFGPSRLEYPLFNDGSTESFNKLILRAGFGNSMTHHVHSERSKIQYIRDLWAKKTQLDMGHLSTHGNYVHLYLNGIYWGIYNPTERIDADFARTYLGGDESDWDVVKDRNELVDGNLDAWNAMFNLANAGLADNEIYQRFIGNNPNGTPNAQYDSYLDVINFADYIIINLYGSNWDWDDHNWAAFRNRVNPGKGFQFFCWDSEHIIEDINRSDGFNNNTDRRPMRLFRALMANQDFQRLFADRLQFHFSEGGLLSSQKNINRWMEFANILEPVIITEAARWGDYRRDVHPWRDTTFDLYGKDYWEDQLNFIINNYFPNRQAIFFNQLRNAGWFPDTQAPNILVNDAPVLQNHFNPGDILTMTANSGTIYYTTDGSDPLLTESSNSQSFTLFSEEESKAVLVPTENLGNDWRNTDYNDSEWISVNGAPGGVGYENTSGYEEWILLDVSEYMFSGNNPNTTCYIRIGFTLDQITLQEINSLLLKVRYDDGFVAYLNGTEVARMNAPVQLTWNSAASSGHEANSLESFNISNYIDNMVAGDNIIAIHALNASVTSSDFIINAELTGSNAGEGDGISPQALVYSSPLELTQSMHVKARAFNNDWSALSQAVLLLPGDFDGLTVTEIHYHPWVEDTTIDDRLYEFLELKNIGAGAINLSGASFMEGINYTFKDPFVLSPGNFVVLASDSLEFIKRYQLNPSGQFDGNLSNDGERIIAISTEGDTFLDFIYNDAEPWPQSADGAGYSLVPIFNDSLLDLSVPQNWRTSNELHGSPGRDDEIVNSVSSRNMNVITGFKLYQNYPNPFNPTTTINYELPLKAFVTLKVYDLLGREVKTLVNKEQQPGKYSVTFKANGLSSGVYFYRLSTTNYSAIKKLILLK